MERTSSKRFVVMYEDGFHSAPRSREEAKRVAAALRYATSRRATVVRVLADLVNCFGGEEARS